MRKTYLILICALFTSGVFAQTITQQFTSCQNNDAFIEIDGVAASTTLTLTFNLGSPNTATGLTATVDTDASGEGVFTITGTNLATDGGTTIEITLIDGVAPGSPVTTMWDVESSSVCFGCASLFYQVIVGELRPYQPLTSTYGNSINTAEPNLNALGYNLRDRLMYAIDRSNLGSYDINESIFPTVVNVADIVIIDQVAYALETCTSCYLATFNTLVS